MPADRAPGLMPSYLLATTARSLILLEGRTGKGWRVDTGREHYYGIARGFGGYCVGVRCRSNASAVPKQDERGRILVFDAGLRLQGEIAPAFPLRDIHQVLAHQGLLWVACSFDDMVAVYDGRRWGEWFPLGAPAAEPRDAHPFHSLSGFGDRLCVVAHNWGATTGKASELFFFRLPGRELDATVTLGNQAHNAWMQDGELMTCSSGEGLLLGVNGSRVATGGFPRGVCNAGGETYVGITEFAPRPERDDSRGWIAAFGPRWVRRRTIFLEGEGMVTDLLAVPGAEAEAMLRNLAPEAIAYPVE
jgi:hypothetical protein